MPKPTQTEMKTAAIAMLKDAIFELEGTLDLDDGIGEDAFFNSAWFKLGLRPYPPGSHEKDEHAFWIDNPHQKWRPILVKVSMPQLTKGGIVV